MRKILSILVAMLFLLQSSMALELGIQVGKFEPLNAGAVLFSDRSFKALAVPEALTGLQFLNAPIAQNQLITCLSPGTLYAITPEEHPSNSLSDRLTAAGFTRLDIPAFQFFGKSANDRALVFKKELAKGDTIRTKKWVVFLTAPTASVEVGSVPGLDWADNDGEVLYNGIVLPRNWPPQTMDPTSDAPMLVPYLETPPDTINISTGRQLFVDDFLVEKTDLTRSFYQAEKYSGNPVFKAETEVERKRGVCYLGHGGVFYDPQAELLKMWYSAGELDGALAVATSPDGINWNRPNLGLPAGGNLLLPKGGRQRGDHAGGDNSVWLDTTAGNPAERIKFMTERLSSDPHWLMTSADGSEWSAPVPAGEAGDYSSFFHNPFRDVWVYSIKRGNSFGRARHYAEATEFLSPQAFDRSVYWCGADSLDKPDDWVRDRPQLYSLGAVAYESLLVGAFYVHLGPDNKICSDGKFPKITEIKLGFSRDGFHWERPDRRAFIPASRVEGTWDRAYIHSTTGVFYIDQNDRLVFPYTGFSGVAPDGSRGIYSGASVGLATLRRDGFASMDAGHSTGTLTTRPLEHQGQYLFVNVDCPEGELRAELLDEAGEVIEPYTLANSQVIQADTTLAQLKWSGASAGHPNEGKPVRVRFSLRNGRLFSFWFSDTTTGASHGFLAAGKIGSASIIDE
ncbi:glycosyl hydrolase family 32 [Coraliomargarita sp. W4R72]